MPSYRLNTGTGSFSLTGNDIGSPRSVLFSVTLGVFRFLPSTSILLLGQGGGILYRWTGVAWMRVF